MNRVETILQKLQQQFAEQLPVDRLLLTVEMLQHELMHLKANLPPVENNFIAISMPLQQIEKIGVMPPLPDETHTPEKIVELLLIDEAAVAAELDEIETEREAVIKLNGNPLQKPQTIYEPAVSTVPPPVYLSEITIVKKEVNEWVSQENTSINDKLKETTTEWSVKLSGAPVKDLKKAIGVNDRFLYINELFRGDEPMYERSIKTINNFTIWPEAEYWIKRELKTKLGWLDSNQTVKQFDQLVKRRFS